MASSMKWIWCMWNSWFSGERFWIVQSSTEPCVVVIAGGLLGSNSVGVAPSTVMKKLVGLAGSLGSEITSEKYNVRLRLGVTEASPANRLPSVTPFAASVVGNPEDELEA